MKQVSGQWRGVLIAILSSCIGGTAAAVTRYLAGNADPLTLASLRWGIGFVCVLPVTLILRARWPQRSDWVGIACLGLAFFGLFFILYNLAVSYTTAARASLALATLPLQTMLVGGLLGVEALTPRKSVGVGIAVFGVVGTLASGLSTAPPGAWHGELVMIGAAFCMACYNVWSRPFIERSSALGFLTVGMGFGAAALILVGVLTHRLAILAAFGARQWIGAAYLGVGGGALAFILWVLALQRATPTRVASTMTVNPIAAALLANQLIGEPFAPKLLFGLVAVFAGIWIATTERQTNPSGGGAAACSVTADSGCGGNEPLALQSGEQLVLAATRSQISQPFLLRFCNMRNCKPAQENRGGPFDAER
jgi:drug/metabolite transporter (DMT)-like permease